MRRDLNSRASNKLDHPNLINVHDSGLLPDGQPYFVMDLEECKLTRDSIPTLQGFPRLVSLRLTDPEASSAPNSFRTQFEKALPSAVTQGK